MRDGRDVLRGREEIETGKRGEMIENEKEEIRKETILRNERRLETEKR